MAAVAPYARPAPSENSFPICRRDTLTACKSMRGAHRRTPNCPSPLSCSREASSVGSENLLMLSAEDGGTENVIRYMWRAGVFFPVGCPARLQTHCAAPSRHARRKEFTEVSRPARPLRLSPPCRRETTSRRVVYSACTKGALVGTADGGVRRFSKLPTRHLGSASA